MLMRAIEGARSAPSYPELAGKRVLITGLTSAGGVDIARAFAEHSCRLVLQFAEVSEPMQAVAELVAPAALETKVYGPVAAATEDVVAFARTAAQAYGGLDAVINLVALEPGKLSPAATTGDIEQLVATRLALPFLMSKVAANRMGLVWNEGLILNVATLSQKAGPIGRAFAAVTKSALNAMTRAQAQEWGSRGIRFNAIAPQVAQEPTEPALNGEPDVASLALYLVSGRGKALSGCVFEVGGR
jgi:NAD(P)-dependent dehydrogenase (short-subunit alcohol dehydrogenase family)